MSDYPNPEDVARQRHVNDQRELRREGFSIPDWDDLSDGERAEQIGYAREDQERARAILSRGNGQ